MTPDELRLSILRWENPHTEFKSVVTDNKALARQLVCFANSDGGQIIVGVDESRTVVGVPDTDALLSGTRCRGGWSRASTRPSGAW